MGIISHRDLFTPKYITAIIKDSSGRGHFIPIKHTIGDYFITEIEKQTFAFKIDDSRIITYKETAARSIRILFYSTKHYLPMSPENTKELEDILNINGLPRVNMMMFGAFKVLSQREKQAKAFESHNLPEIVSAIAQGGQKYALQAQNMETYFKNISVDRVVTPVKDTTEFLEDDFIGTDPKYLGDIYNSIQRVDFVAKKVNNAKIDAKKPWMIIIALVAIVGAIGFMGFYFISGAGSGTGESPFSGILPSFPTNTPTTNTPNGKLTDQEVFAKYPTPVAMHDALVKGDLKMNQLSPNMQKMANSYKPPLSPTVPSVPVPAQ